jgi:hypothetical protein
LLHRGVYPVQIGRIICVGGKGVVTIELHEKGAAVLVKEERGVLRGGFGNIIAPYLFKREHKAPQNNRKTVAAITHLRIKYIR